MRAPKKARRASLLLLAVMIAMVMLASCRTFTKDLATLSPEQAKQDVDHLVRNFKAIHVEPWHSVSDKKFDSEAQQIKARFAKADTVSRKELAMRLSRLIALVGDGHTLMTWWRPFVEYMKDGGTAFPLGVRYTGDGGLVVQKVSDRLPKTSIEPGHQLLMLNGQPVEAMLAECRAHVAGRTSRSRDLRLTKGHRLHALIWFLWGPTERFHLRLRDDDGNVYSELLPAVPGGSDDENGDNENEDAEPPFRYAFYRGGRVCVLEASSFGDSPMHAVTGDIEGRFNKLLDEMFNAMAEKDTQVLVVDVRRNGGGKAVEKDLLRRIADEPFRDYAERWRYTAALRRNALIYGLHELDVPAWLMLDHVLDVTDFVSWPDPNEVEGEYLEDESELIEPHEDAWDGELVVAAGRGTFSAAVSLTAMVKDNDLGMVVGEETRGPASAYGGPAPILLPNSGLTAFVAVDYNLRPSGHDDGRGVMPDHELPTDLSEEELVDHIVSLLESPPEQRTSHSGQER